MSTPRSSVPTQMSAFQLPESTRASELEIKLRRPKSESQRPYMIAIVVLAVCMIASLVFLLAM